jgi:ATP-dependent DNA helicase RecQ
VRARSGQSGIVYCLSRKTVEATAEFLRDQGVRALAYHAGLDPETRTRVQDAFQKDEAEVIAATVAFGMGVDKPNIRYVVHRDMPRSLEGYYQEIGRAGRDGQASDCVLFYSWADVVSFDRFTDGVDDPEVAEWQRRQARAMYRFAESASCRHQALVGHFGEAMEPCGGSCDACTGEDPVEAASHQVVVRRRRGGSGAAGSGGAGSGGAVRRAAPIVDGGDARVFEALRALRRRLADERNVPAYCVFPDAVLLEMAVRRPADEAALREIPGVGAKKLALYGEAFLAAVRGA